MISSRLANNATTAERVGGEMALRRHNTVAGNPAEHSATSMVSTTFSQAQTMRSNAFPCRTTDVMPRATSSHLPFAGMEKQNRMRNAMQAQRTVRRDLSVQQAACACRHHRIPIHRIAAMAPWIKVRNAMIATVHRSMDAPIASWIFAATACWMPESSVTMVTALLATAAAYGASKKISAGMAKLMMQRTSSAMTAMILMMMVVAHFVALSIAAMALPSLVLEKSAMPVRRIP